MRIVLTFALNAGLNLALGLAVAALLSPDDYGRFAVGNTVSVVLAMALFDWLRLSATRYYGEIQRGSDPSIRATLNLAYLVLTVCLAVALALALALRVDFGLGPALLAAAALAGLGNGYFDYYSALARARFRDRTYARIIILKNVLAFGLGIGCCFFVRDPAVALGAISFGVLLALLPVHRELQDAEARSGAASTARLRVFARYGFPVVIANVVFQIILLMNRGSAAAWFGYADSGQLSLATDMTLRVFLAVGSAVDVFIFQLAVRRDAEEGRGAAERQLRVNIVVVVAILGLLTTGYAMAMPAFQALLIPERYHGAFSHLSLVLLPGIFAFCLGQFALNPIFQVAHRTRPLVAAAAVSLGADAIGLLLVPRGYGITGVAAVHSASLVIGTVAIAAIAFRQVSNRPPLAQIAQVLVAALATALAMWPLRSIEPAWLSLSVAMLVGTAIYGAVLMAFDVAGIREAALAHLSPRFRRTAVQGA